MKPFSLIDSLNFSRKKFFRAPQWEFKLAIRILLGFVVLYFLVAFLFLGIGGYYLLKKQNPETDPIFLINSFLGIYFAVDLLIRYFFQAIPVTEVKSLLLLPITKRVIIRGVLVRSLGSIFNVVPLVILLPFCIVHSVENGMTDSVWIWFLSIICFSLSNNYLTFLINKSNKIAAVFLGVFAIEYVLDYFFNFSISHYFGLGLEFIYTNPYWAVIPVIIIFTAILLADNFLRQQLFLDKGLSTKKERIIGSNLDFFDRWERMGFFLKNDLRLIIRNIRARQVVLMVVLFLFYGLFFFTQDQYSEMPSMLIFAGLFITGGFMITFGQYVPAWDSEYYSFLMCQNLSYRRYLKSKLYLMMFSVVVSSILSLPYLYFGSKVMLIIWASGIFNLGFGSMITLYSGAFNTNPVKLNIKAKAFENTQNFSFIQLLFILPKLILPLLVFYIPYTFFGFYVGLLGLVFIGLSGVIFQKQLLNVIVKTYQKKKYQTIASFNN